jgi:hypothetical protein
MNSPKHYFLESHLHPSRHLAALDFNAHLRRFVESSGYPGGAHFLLWMIGFPTSLT